MNTDKSTNNGSANTITFGGLLQLTFIILKLCKVIDWSWFWVLFPTILSVGIVILVIIGALIAGVIVGLIRKARRKGKSE